MISRVIGNQSSGELKRCAEDGVKWNLREPYLNLL